MVTDRLDTVVSGVPRGRSATRDAAAADAGVARQGANRRPRVAVALLLALLALLALGITGAPATAAADGPKARLSIAGGYFPAADAWPWTTAIIDRTRTPINGDLGWNTCTAVLIAPQRVLTAAHCIVGADQKTPKPAGQFQVVIGRRDLALTAQGERRNVTGIAVHPKVYLPQTGVHTYHAFYDIAVMFLDAPATIPPATLAAATDWNSWGTVMGFGHFNYDHANPQYDRYLRAADYDMLTDAQCGAYFDDLSRQHFYPTIHVCANNAPGQNVDCVTHGDSGGPLMIRTAAGWRLIGITSFYPHRSDRCGAGGPFGFAWVAGPEMRDWPLTVPHPPVTGGGGEGEAGGGSPVVLSMTLPQVRTYVRKMIRDNTNGRIRKLRATCPRTSESSYKCRLSWRIGRRGFKGNAEYWHYQENGQAYWTYVFNGERRPLGCRRCRAIRLKW
jgi:hypothetical protein